MLAPGFTDISLPGCVVGSREGGTGLMLLLLIHSFIHTGDQTKKTDFYSCNYSFKTEY